MMRQERQQAYRRHYQQQHEQHLQQRQRHKSYSKSRRQSPKMPAVQSAMDRIRTGWSDSFCLDLVSLDADNVHHMAYFLYHHQGMVRQLRLYACSLPQQAAQQSQQQNRQDHGGQRRGQDPPTSQDRNNNRSGDDMDVARSEDHEASFEQLRAFVQESGFLQKVTLSYCELGNDILAKLLLRQDANAREERATSATDVGGGGAPSKVQELDLSRNQLQGTRGGEILGQIMVHEMPRLKKIDLQINPSLGPGGMLALQSTLQQAMLTMPMVLQDLNLRCCGLGNEGLNALVDILTDPQHDYFPELTHLNLAYNDIQGTVGGTALAKLLKRHEGLQKLRLSGNALNVGGARALASGLVQNEKSSLETLRLDYCQVGDDGLQAIVDSLTTVSVTTKKSGTTHGDSSALKVLTLHSNGFTSHALPALTRLLNHKESRLEHLNLSTNRHLLTERETPTTATTTLPASHPSRRRSQPEAIPTPSVAALTQEFALSVAHNTKLRTLSVYECGVEDDHVRAMVFLETLKCANTTLESLRLAGSSSSSNGKKTLGQKEIEALCEGFGRRNKLLSQAASLQGPTTTSSTIVFGLSRVANEKDGSSAAFQIVRDKLFFPMP